MLDEKYVKALAEVVKTAGNDPTRKSAFAAVMMNVIQPNRLTLDLFSAFLPVVSLNPGDEIARKVTRSRYPVRTMVPMYLGQ